MIKIDKDVPMRGHYRTKYPWNDMDVGDSFFSDSKRVQTAMTSWNSLHPDTRFTSRRAIENGVEGYRVWRVK